VTTAAPLLACLLPLLALGCAAEGPEEAAAAMRDALASTRASLALAGVAPAPPAAPADAPRPAARAAPQALPAALPQPGAPRLRGAAPPASAAALMGARAEDLRRMLGEPSLSRADGDAEIWLYEAPACRLDVILYAEGGALRVAHAAARALAEGGAVTEAACLAAIAAAPATAPWPGTGRRA
jgi:hypothetical protein